jgi:hypothetical protein
MTLTANNYCTISAGSNHAESHSPKQKACGTMFPQECDGKRTYRCIKKPHLQVTILNEIPTQSRRSRLGLDNPAIHSSNWKSISESSLSNRYGTRRSHNVLVVCRATMYNTVMTEPETKPPYCKQSAYQKCWEEAPWSTLPGKESQLESSQQA